MFQTCVPRVVCEWSEWGRWSSPERTCDEAVVGRRRRCRCGTRGCLSGYEERETQCRGNKREARREKLPTCYKPPPVKYGKPKTYREEPKTYEQPSST